MQQRVPVYVIVIRLSFVVILFNYSTVEITGLNFVLNYIPVVLTIIYNYSLMWLFSFVLFFFTYFCLINLSGKTPFIFTSHLLLCFFLMLH